MIAHNKPRFFCYLGVVDGNFKAVIFLWAYVDCMFRESRSWIVTCVTVLVLALHRAYFVCVHVCLRCRFLMKAWSRGIYQSSSTNKRPASCAPLLLGTPPLLLLPWQLDKVPFQLEKYLATYLPTAILAFYFSCHLIRSPCYFYSEPPYHRVPAAHVLMFIPPLHLLLYNEELVILFWCLCLGLSLYW